MARGWELSLINNPDEAIKTRLSIKWRDVLEDVSKWMQKELIPAMIYGSKGIRGIQALDSTPFYAWILSPDGLSQLGIERSQPPKLLQAYMRAYKVLSNDRMLFLQFGDTAILKMMTPHPASETGDLKIESWMEWVLDGEKVTNRGFVPRSQVPRGLRKNIRIRSAPGGLMLPGKFSGSSGSWEFPPAIIQLYMMWLEDNVKAIQQAINDQVIISLNKVINK